MPNEPSLQVKNRSLLAFFHLIGLGLKLGVSCTLMLLLKFSTSPYCRKVGLALGYKGIPLEFENLTPGLQVLKLKPLTGGLKTVPMLLPQLDGQPPAIADSTQILHSIESCFVSRPLLPAEKSLHAEAGMKASSWPLDLFTTSFEPVRASKSTRRF